MARRNITVRDVGEVLEHWQAGRSVRAINRSLGTSRPTIRKYKTIAEAHGFKPSSPPPPEGWRAFLEKAAPELFNPGAGSAMFAELCAHHDAIKEALKQTTVMTCWQRLREDPGLKASYSSFYRGYLGLWENPLTGRRHRLWVFANVLSCCRHIFARAVPVMDQAAWLESHVANFQF